MTLATKLIAALDGGADPDVPCIDDVQAGFHANLFAPGVRDWVERLLGLDRRTPVDLRILSALAAIGLGAGRIEPARLRREKHPRGFIPIDRADAADGGVRVLTLPVSDRLGLLDLIAFDPEDPGSFERPRVWRLTGLAGFLPPHEGLAEPDGTLRLWTQPHARLCAWVTRARDLCVFEGGLPPPGAVGALLLDASKLDLSPPAFAAMGVCRVVVEDDREAARWLEARCHKLDKRRPRPPEFRVRKARPQTGVAAE